MRNRSGQLSYVGVQQPDFWPKPVSLRKLHPPTGYIPGHVDVQSANYWKLEYGGYQQQSEWNNRAILPGMTVGPADYLLISIAGLFSFEADVMSLFCRGPRSREKTTEARIRIEKIIRECCNPI